MDSQVRELLRTAQQAPTLAHFEKLAFASKRLGLTVYLWTRPNSAISAYGYDTLVKLEAKKKLITAFWDMTYQHAWTMARGFRTAWKDWIGKDRILGVYLLPSDLTDNETESFPVEPGPRYIMQELGLRDE